MVRDTKTTTNRFSLGKDGIIRAVYNGTQTAASMQRVTDRLLKIMQPLIDDDKPVMLLADIRGMGDFDQSARLVDMHARTVLPFWRMALVTSDDLPPSEMISRTITSMSGRKKEIRYFQKEADAIGWVSVARNGHPATLSGGSRTHASKPK